MSILNICQAVSFQMGEWPSLFETPVKYLEHLLFVIGNGVEEDEETSSFIVERYPHS